MGSYIYARTARSLFSSDKRTIIVRPDLFSRREGPISHATTTRALTILIIPEEKKKEKSSFFILHNLSRKTTARLKRFHGPPFLFIKRQNSISTSSLHYLPYLVISRRHNHMYLGTLKYLQSIRTTHIAYLYTCTS